MAELIATNRKLLERIHGACEAHQALSATCRLHAGIVQHGAIGERDGQRHRHAHAP